MLELTRLAALEPAERLAEVVCVKLGQCLPQHGNLLLIGVPAPAEAG